jgi:hypothetical protein
MPRRSRTTFKKRQKELLRIERQREKAAKRLARRPASKETGALQSESEEANGVEPVDDNLAIPDAGHNVPSM